MHFSIITLFPEMLQALNVGITGRAQKEGLISISAWNPRDYAHDKHHTVDDHPYGGGPGMVMMAPPLLEAIAAAKLAAPTPPKVIYLSPQGKRFDQTAAAAFAKESALILLAGRYEGIDERVIELAVDEEWSIGDYVLTGGELPALIMIDAITRLLPGAVGDQDSIDQDSLTTGRLKYPQYTKPEEFAGKSVPKVLLSGHHKNIATWRLTSSLQKTRQRRPDLLTTTPPTAEETLLLQAFIDLERSKN